MSLLVTCKRVGCLQGIGACMQGFAARKFPAGWKRLDRLIVVLQEAGMESLRLGKLIPCWL